MMVDKKCRKIAPDMKAIVHKLNNLTFQISTGMDMITFDMEQNDSAKMLKHIDFVKGSLKELTTLNQKLESFIKSYEI